MQVWRKWAKGEGVGGKVDVIPGISNRLRSVENLNQMGLIENYEKHKRDLTNGKITEKEFLMTHDLGRLYYLKGLDTGSLNGYIKTHCKRLRLVMLYLF